MDFVIFVKFFKVGLSPSKKLFYLFQWKPFKNDENAFYFSPQDIEISALIFSSCRKTA